MSQAPRHSFTADFADPELLLDGEIDEPLLYESRPVEPREWRGVVDATPIVSSASLIVYGRCRCNRSKTIENLISRVSRLNGKYISNLSICSFLVDAYVQCVCVRFNLIVRSNLNSN